MAYCTLEDLKEKISEEELIELTDDGDTGVIVSSRIDAAIADGDALIDGHCAGRYAVPFDTVPPLVRKWSVEIAIYNLLQRKSGADEDRQRDYDNAVKLLGKVQIGKMSLGVQPVPDPPEADGYTGGMQVSTRDKIFGADTMEKY